MEKLSFSFKELYDKKDYQGVLNLDKSIEDKEQYDHWVYYYIIKSYSAIKQYNNAFNRGKIYLNKFRGHEKDAVKNAIGWACYYQYIKSNDEIKNLIKPIDWVACNFKQEDFSPYEKSIQKIIKLIYDEKSKKRINFELGNKYLSLLNPDNLNKLEKEIIQKDKVIKMGSDMERWYSRKTKTLYELKEYDECLNIIDKAFKSISQFHNNNEHWFKYRQACCYIELGKLDKAKEILLDILKYFEHWCIYDSLHLIEKRKGNFEETLKIASITALSDNEHKLRVSFYKEFGKYLCENNLEEIGQYHYRLVNLIRQEEDWQINKELDNLIILNNIKASDKNTVLKILKQFWMNKKFLNVEFNEGSINKLMADNKIGFIKDDSGKNYFFKTNKIERKDKLCVGQKVKFTIKECFNKKKNKMELVANDIIFI